MTKKVVAFNALSDAKKIKARCVCTVGVYGDPNFKQITIRFFPTKMLSSGSANIANHSSNFANHGLFLLMFANVTIYKSRDVLKQQTIIATFFSCNIFMLRNLYKQVIKQSIHEYSFNYFSNIYKLTFTYIHKYILQIINRNNQSQDISSHI